MSPSPAVPDKSPTGVAATWRLPSSPPIGHFEHLAPLGAHVPTGPEAPLTFPGEPPRLKAATFCAQPVVEPGRRVPLGGASRRLGWSAFTGVELRLCDGQLTVTLSQTSPQRRLDARRRLRLSPAECWRLGLVPGAPAQVIARLDREELVISSATPRAGAGLQFE